MVYRTNFRHGPSGGHGLPKVSLGPAMPYPLCPAGVSPQGGRSAAVFYPLGYPTPLILLEWHGKFLTSNVGLRPHGMEYGKINLRVWVFRVDSKIVCLNENGTWSKFEFNWSTREWWPGVIVIPLILESALNWAQDLIFSAVYLTSWKAVPKTEILIT